MEDIIQSETFSNNSHIRMLLPRTTDLYKTLLYFPMTSNALSRTRFINPSTPTTVPSSYLFPFSLSLSFLPTYLLRSAEYPCFD